MTNWIHQIGCDLADTGERDFICEHEMSKAKGLFEDMVYCWKCENGCQCRFIIEAYERGRQEIIKRVRELHKPSKNGEYCTHCEVGQVSGYDYADYPCDTIKALEGDK